MNIQILKRAEINENLWNDCIRKGENNLAYGYCEYLDVVTDGFWMGLVLGEYEVVFPLPLKKKIGLTYIVQPLFCAQLGAFGSLENPHVFQEDFIHAIPWYFLRTRLHLNGYFPIKRDFNMSHKNYLPKENYILDLQHSYQPNKDAQKNIARLVEKGVQYKINEVEANEIVGYYQKQWGDLNPLISKGWYQKLLTLCEKFQNNRNVICEVVSAHSLDGRCLGGGIFFKTQSIEHTKEADASPWKNKGFIHYVCGAANNENPESKGVMHGVLDFFIRKHLNQPMVFDFEGSSIDSVAAFYKKFNPISKPYFFIKKGF